MFWKNTEPKTLTLDVHYLNKPAALSTYDLLVDTLHETVK